MIEWLARLIRCFPCWLVWATLVLGARVFREKTIGRRSWGALVGLVLAGPHRRGQTIERIFWSRSARDRPGFISGISIAAKSLR